MILCFEFSFFSAELQENKINKNRIIKVNFIPDKSYFSQMYKRIIIESMKFNMVDYFPRFATVTNWTQLIYQESFFRFVAEIHKNKYHYLNWLDSVVFLRADHGKSVSILFELIYRLSYTAQILH